MVAAPPRLSGSNVRTGVLDMGVASFFTSTGLGAGCAGEGTIPWEMGLGGSSSRRLFHMRPPSRVKYEFVHDDCFLVYGASAEMAILNCWILCRPFLNKTASTIPRS